jgi:NAD(P)-dependent dehydrogenase (short-subunit alcohol dehydrogenase family)
MLELLSLTQYRLSIMSDTWLITGASKGLGAHLALHALRAGHTVIACSRDVVKAKKALPEIERLRGTWLELDVSDDEAEGIVSRAVELHRVNVLVNNAGYAVVGTLDHVT